MYLVALLLIMEYWGGDEYSTVKGWLNKSGYIPVMELYILTKILSLTKRYQVPLSSFSIWPHAWTCP